MVLFRLELKRVLKTRSTRILLALALLFSVLLAYIPITFSYVTVLDGEGVPQTLKGLSSIRFIQEIQSPYAGPVTDEKLQAALRAYQACFAKYGVESSSELPEGVYAMELLPHTALTRGLKQALADPSTGQATGLTGIDPERIVDYPGLCQSALSDRMALRESRYPAVQEAAKNLYRQVEQPLQFYPGYDGNAMDYQLLCVFLVLVFCTVIAAPIFTSDYQTGADDILRCTKYGGVLHAFTKIFSALLICCTSFLLCAVTYIVVSNCLFGWESTRISFQLLYSIINLPNMTIGQTQWFIALAGLLSLAASTCLTLLLSSRARSQVVSVSAALGLCLLPVIVYLFLPASLGKWIYNFLPAAGLALQSSFLYALRDFEFLSFGNLCLWSPHVMLISCAIEIPLLIALTVHSYVHRHH